MMNKFMIGALALLVGIVSGCKSIPTVDTMTKTSTAIGYSAGLVANQIKIDDVSRNAVIDIVNKVNSVIPNADQSFTDVWMPIATAHVAKLVNEKKIDAGQANLILGAFKVAVNGLDYLFDVRWPKAKTYEELVVAAVHGFNNGFLTTFKPADTVSAEKIEYDIPAFNYLKAKSTL